MTGIKICFCSWPGGGTSSAAKELQRRLAQIGFEFEILSTGSIFRSLAAARYPDLDPVTALARLEVDAKEDKEIDRFVDYAILDAMRSDENMIFDSRLAPHFSRVADYEKDWTMGIYCVYLYCTLWTSATRVASRDNDVPVDQVTLAMKIKALMQNRHRRVMAAGRYKKLYGIGSLGGQISVWDQRFNTGKVPTERIVDVVMQDLTIKGWLG